MAILKRWAARAAWAAALVLVTVVVGRAFESRRLPDLELWHRMAPAREVRAADVTPGFTLTDYLAREEEVFSEVARDVSGRLGSRDASVPNRYVAASVSSPTRQAFDGNRTFERVPAQIRGGALLVHGLTDAPYSLHAVADLFASQGLYALSLRMPGHGTVPAALTSATWEDWMAAVRIGMRHVRQRAGASTPIYLVGYSNGGALAVKYSLDALRMPDLPRADRLVLLSPMIGVSPFARFAWMMSVFGWVPYFEQSRWLDVLPEYLPFKYTSFPVNAGRQTYRLTTALSDQLREAAESNRIRDLPPILTFQSLVDTTVRTDAVIHELYDRLDRDGSELVLFDVNRQSRIAPFFRADWADPLPAAARPYRLTVVTNASPDTLDVIEQTTAPGSREMTARPLGLAWPPMVFSLTHIALPFPPSDAVFGTGAPGETTVGLRLGALEPRGERDLLLVPAEQFMRLSYNPFYPYVEARLRDWVAPAQP
jgi:alpha-beta hydrolase superfamily lysophospholipase